MASARNLYLQPQSVLLDSYARPVEANRVDGYGVLSGKWISARNAADCDGWYNAYATDHRFEYSQSDPRFSEGMAYLWGDRFLQWFGTEGQGYGFDPKTLPLPVVARCGTDNAFYSRDPESGFQFVCIGVSTSAKGSSYTDDASVVVHEIQHGLTTNAYSDKWGLNQFNYDEAGALNEAVSDFMSLMFLEPYLPSGWDLRTFSRWALGQFYRQVRHETHARGAHACPEYDPRFPNCTGGPAFSADQNHITFSYPDGLSWPYAQNYVGPGYARSAFLAPTVSAAQIHGNSTIITGALWDVYQALKAAHGGQESVPQVRGWMISLIEEAISLLPYRGDTSSTSMSPVNFRIFGAKLVQAAGAILKLPLNDQTLISNALAARGLFGGPIITDANWAAVGAGAKDPADVIQAPGLKIEDGLVILKNWLNGINPAVRPPQGPAIESNRRLNPGEIAAVWFDIRNTGALTAGGVNVDVTIQDPSNRVTFVDGRYRSQDRFDPLNPGRVSATRAQIMYPKIYGSDTVAALRSTNVTMHVPVGTTYFTTDPAYSGSIGSNGDPRLALWIDVPSDVPRGTTVNFVVTATPANGVASTVTFPAKVW